MVIDTVWSELDSELPHRDVGVDSYAGPRDSRGSGCDGGREMDWGSRRGSDGGVVRR